MHSTFDAGSFKDIADSPLGQELWGFLHEPDNLVRMETACYLSRPAIEPLSPGLLIRFGEPVRQDRIKQMIGRMVRQTIEPRGYQIDQQNVRITRENMFTSGTRYVERANAS